MCDAIIGLKIEGLFRDTIKKLLGDDGLLDIKWLDEGLLEAINKLLGEGYSDSNIKLLVEWLLECINKFIDEGFWDAINTLLDEGNSDSNIKLLDEWFLDAIGSF